MNTMKVSGLRKTNPHASIPVYTDNRIMEIPVYYTAWSWSRTILWSHACFNMSKSSLSSHHYEILMQSVFCILRIRREEMKLQVKDWTVWTDVTYRPARCTMCVQCTYGAQTSVILCVVVEHSGSVDRTEVIRPFCVGFSCSPHVCVSSSFPTIKNMNVTSPLLSVPLTKALV